MEIVNLYESILDAGGLISDKEGFVSVNSKKFGVDKNTPCLVDGKRLVLPTDQQLRSPNNGDRIVFHPLSENALRGESEVVTKLRNVLTIRLNYTIAALMNAIIDITQDTNTHKYLTPEQSEILSIAPEIDDKSAIDFTQLAIKVMNEESKSSFVTIYLKRSGTIGSNRYARIGVVSFPLYEELCKDGDTCLGVRLRKKDRQSFKAVLEYILPRINEPESYNRGSDSEVAPYLDALMKTFMAVGAKLNDCVELLDSKLDCKELLVINSEWVDSFDNLSLLMKKIRMIPMQLGNEGSQKLDSGQKQNEVQTTGYIAPAAPMAARSVPSVPPPLQYTTPVVQEPIRQQQVYQPPQQFQQPVQAFEAPAVKHTARGVDFDSIMRHNAQVPVVMPPNMLMNTPQYQQLMYQQQQMQMQNSNGPRSASNNYNVGLPMNYQPQQPMYQPQQPMYQPQQFQQPQQPFNPNIPQNFSGI